MKYITFIYITVVLLFSSISCKKSFLDVNDNAVILREQYVADLKSLQHYLNGMYIILARDIYGAAFGPEIYTDLIADNIKPSNVNTFIQIPHYTWNQSPNKSSSDTNIDPLWKSNYQLIRSCSYVIERAEILKGENTAKANQIKGEAYCLRAFAHFILVNVFAQSYNYTPNGSHPGVPYITSWDWNDSFTRNTVKEVYDEIINDLTEAISLLPASSINKLTMNHYAAKALLARVYLFKEDWEQAKKLATEVTIAVPLLTSASYPSKLFTPEETEALFQLAPSSTQVIQGSYDTDFQSAYFSSAATFFIATKDIAMLFKQDPGDSRNAWISSSIDGIDSIRKFPSNVIPGFGIDTYSQARSYYPSLLRSSEMFLTVSEAAANIGDENTARIYLDLIRKRANPGASTTTATGAELLKIIHIERRKELAFEGLRMWDLQRWKQDVKRIDAAIGAPLVLAYPNDKAVAPIPLIDVNSNISQNPSY